MSHYAFFCLDCQKEFTRNMHMSEFDQHQASCPHCDGKRVTQMVGAFSAVTAKKS